MNRQHIGTLDVTTHIEQMACAAHDITRADKRFVSIRLRKDQLVLSARGVRRCEQHARHGLQLAVQRELAIKLAPRER